MPEFYGFTVVMALLAMLFVLLPLMAGRSQPSAKRSQVNITVFREQLDALELARQAGNYTEQEYIKLKTDLQRHLLEDAGDGVQSPVHASSKRSRLLLALLVPLLAFTLYERIGSLADWQITQTLDGLQQSEDEVGRKQMLEQLASELASRTEQVDTPDYYLLLGRTQMELNNYPAAVDAYRHLSLVAANDPEVLGQYAQALYLASGRKMTPEVRRVADQALALNPHQTTVLGMMGIASFESGDYAEAANYWEQLLPVLPPESQNAQMIRQGIAQARAMEGESPAVAPVDELQAVDTGVSLQVAVSLSDSLPADPNASVFVFARAIGGPPMPLAVARLRVADLPAEVTLDDSMAMTPALKLSSFEQVEVVARISKRGIANRGSGDLEGAFGPVTPADSQQLISVQINRVLP
jgi:cytochrome c-type biogenesis protein CcmH